MKLYSLFKLLTRSLLSLTCLLSAHGEMRSGLYDLRDRDMGTSHSVLKVTSARSHQQCLMLCMATDQCVTAGYVDNQCTLSTRRIDGQQKYTKFESPGERLYSLRCVPRWTGMCNVMNITGLDTGDCNGIYTLVDDMVYYDRPVYMKGAQYRYLYYHLHTWVIGAAVNGLGYNFCFYDNCAPEMPQCYDMQIECLGWLQ